MIRREDNNIEEKREFGVLTYTPSSLFCVYRNKFLKNMGIFHRNKKFFLSMKKYRDVLS